MGVGGWGVGGFGVGGCGWGRVVCGWGVGGWTTVVVVGWSCAIVCWPRILLNNAGIVDILQFDGSSPTPSIVEHYQQEDLVAMGHLLVCLATGSLTPPDEGSYAERMGEIAVKFSEDVTNVIR